jgi:hypothetical protein
VRVFGRAAIIQSFLCGYDDPLALSYTRLFSVLVTSRSLQKNGLVLSSRIDQHAGNPQARLLIGAILKADPSE